MQVVEMTRFYEVIEDDHRITVTHISMYMALFEFWNENEFQNPIEITRKQIMDRAKIGGLATFHKCIKELEEYGYIHYRPSRNPAISSRVVMIEL